MNIVDLTLPEGWIAGVDLSRAQGTVNAQALVDAGVAFCWIKATDGLHDVDADLVRNYTACRDAGLPFGLYAVIEPYGADHAAAQAEHFLNIADGIPASLPPALDFELDHGRSAIDLLASAEAWCSAVEAAARAPILYTGPAFLAHLELLAGPRGAGVSASLAARPLWVSDYGWQGASPQQNIARGGPHLPAPWADWTVWQVSGNGGIALPGGRGWVDLDVTRLSVEELQALGMPCAEGA